MKTKMKRKVVKQGPATFMVSIPSPWIKKYNIKKGDLMEIEEVDKYLKISIEKDTGITTTEFNACDLDFNHIRRYLHEIYKAGYDEVRILTESSKDVAKIQNFISTILLGYEIVDQQSSSVVVRSISKALEEEFDPILRRSFLVTKQLGSNSYELIKNHEIRKLKDVIVLEETSEKLTNFCQRVLIKKGYKKYAKTCCMYCIVREIKKIADEYKVICNHMMVNNLVLDAKVIGLYGKVNSLYNQFYELFYSYDPKSVTDFSSNCDALLIEAERIHSSVDQSQSVIVSHLSMLIRQISQLLDPYLGVVV